MIYRVTTRFLLLSAPLIALLIGCSITRGAAEFIAYRDAFQASRDASNSLFDLMEIAEREQERIVARRERNLDFNPDRDRIFSDLSIPPLTEEYRQSFEAVTRFNELMYGLVTGERAAVLTEQASGLAREIIGITELASGGASTFQTQPLLAILEATAQPAIALQNRRVFSAALADETDAVLALMAEMRAGTPTVFLYLITASGTEKQDEVVRLMADWVVLIDRNISALQEAQSAARSEAVSQIDLVALQARVSEVGAAVRAVREGLASLASQG